MSDDTPIPPPAPSSDRSGRSPVATIAFVVALVGLIGFDLGIGALGSISNDQTAEAVFVRIAFPVWAVVALALGVLGRILSRDRQGRGLATAAIVLALVELVGATYLALAVTGCINDASHCR